MPIQPMSAVVKKLKSLPPERVSEVEDFIDFLHSRDQDRGLVKAATQLSEKALEPVWDNPLDADYDRL